MVNRLYQSKEISDNDEGKLTKVQLSYDEAGHEQWVPVKQVTLEEQKAYLCGLYDRGREQKEKTKKALADKWLQPLGKPRKVV